MSTSTKTYRTSTAGTVILLLVGVIAGSPTSSAAQIDSGHLMTDLSALSADSMQGRRVGSEGGAAARRYLVRRLEEIGLEVTQSDFTTRDGVGGVNVEAVLPGTDSERGEIVLTAHYDHLGTRDGEIFNGTDDNASGTAGILAIARVLRRAPMRHTVRIIFFDAEEGGLQGARAWVAAAQEGEGWERVRLNVNLDMVSRSEEELFVTGTYQNPDLRPVLEEMIPAPGVTLRFGHDTPEDRGAANWVSASDHGAFHAVGIPFLYFGVEDHPDYHRPSDTIEKVDSAWYLASIETILMSLRALDAAGL